jgi:hypothetical protein
MYIIEESHMFYARLKEFPTKIKLIKLILPQMAQINADNIKYNAYVYC